MGTGFKETNSIKKQRPADHPQKDYAFWECEQPQYDHRSSSFVNTGTHYGVGINQPVGHAGDPKQRVSTMPFGRVNTLRVDEKG